MRIALLTSVDIRHRYVARFLAKRFDVVAVGYEQTGYHPIDTRLDELSVSEKEMAQTHFEERTRQEEKYFGHDAAFLTPSDGPAIIQIEPGCLNHEKTLTFLDQQEPEVVVVYGTNLIKSALLKRWSGNMINMHLGLSPYYRGTATNFYPLLNDQLQFIGATIHSIDAGIDSGAIFAHARPAIVAEDMPHTIGCKAIQAGLDALVNVLGHMSDGRGIAPVPQWEQPGARLYLRKDYHPRQVAALYRLIEGGLISRYVERASEVAPLVKLVSLADSVPTLQAGQRP